MSPPTYVRNGSNVGGRVLKNLSAQFRRSTQLVRLHEWHPTLVHEDPSRCEDTSAVSVEGLSEKHFPRACRVCAIDDDNIERTSRCVGDVGDPIANDDVCTRIGPRISRDVG